MAVGYVLFLSFKFLENTEKTVCQNRNNTKHGFLCRNDGSSAAEYLARAQSQITNVPYPEIK